MQDVLLRVCDAKLSRNYLDVPEIERGVRQIVKISNVMRGLRPTAFQPDPPRHAPVTQGLDKAEARTYGGMKASRLVRVLKFIRGLRRSHGEKAAAGRVLNMSSKLMNGIDIYTRVKALVSNLIEAVNAPETAMTPRRPNTKIQKTRPSTAFTWEVSPSKIYGWKQTQMRKGYDGRQTSVYWLEKQSSALKRAVYRDHHGIKPLRSTPRLKPEPREIETRIYHPPSGARLTDQIWPPIDLVRLIEERRGENASHGNKEDAEISERKEALPPYGENSRPANPQYTKATHERYETPRPDE